MIAIYKKRLSFLEKAKNIILLHFAFFLYSFVSLFAKLASNFDLFSQGFFGFFALEILFLFFYSLLWQIILRNFPLSVAYVNKSIVIFWVLLWSRLFFQEYISFNNIIGVIVIFFGVFLVSSND